MRSLFTSLSSSEQKIWEQFESAQKDYDEATLALFAVTIITRDTDETLGDLDHSRLDTSVLRPSSAGQPELDALEEIRNRALDSLNEVLTTEQAERLRAILASKEAGRDALKPPRFDLGQIQRYILWRVFDLGWTTKRFGHFDRYSIGYEGRAATKAERIGKKYQWIAYHEIIALVADHFQP
jgi:hypothetical protein